MAAPAALRPDRAFGWWLLGILAVALLLRVTYTVAVLDALPWGGYQSDADVVRSLDEAYYLNGAHALVDGDWFHYPFFGFGPAEEQGSHPPLTAVVLAPAALFTEADLPKRLIGALAGVATVAVIGLVGRTVAGDRAGLVAAAIAAVYPNIWMNDGLIMAETWAMLAVALVMLAMLRLLRTPTWTRAAVVGLACGVAMLARSELALLVPLYAGYLLVVLGPRGWKERLRIAGALALAAGLTVSPWVLHNLARFEEPVFLSHADGDVLIGANCDDTYYGDVIGFHTGRCLSLYPVDTTRDGSATARERRDLALEYMRANLGRLPVVMAARLGRMWSVYAPGHAANIQQTEGRPAWASRLGLAAYWALAAAAVAGAVVLVRRGRPLFPLLAPVVVVSVNAVLFFGFVRHRTPAEPSIVVLAATAIVAGRRGLVERPAR